ncbi:MAG: hypothetical protein WD598_13230 [Acidimicrobiia bacterium]
MSANHEQRVTLVVPANPEYLRLARLAAADAGSRAGFNYEEIDDLRIGVNELCHVLIGTGAAGTVAIDFHTEPNAVIVEGFASTPGASVDNEFTETILTRVVDEHAVTDADDGRRFRLVKHGRV